MDSAEESEEISEEDMRVEYGLEVVDSTWVIGMLAGEVDLEYGYYKGLGKGTR